MENKFDTQLLIEGHDLDEDVIHDYFIEHFIPAYRLTLDEI